MARIYDDRKEAMNLAFSITAAMVVNIFLVLIMHMMLLLFSHQVISDFFMDCSTPGFPVLTISQSLPKFMSIESVMPSNHFILFCHLALNLSQHQGLFQRVSSLNQVAKVLELQLQHQSFQRVFRVDFL